MKQCSQIKTHLQAAESGFPTLARLKKNIGSEKVQAYIELWIANLLSFINVGKTMNDDQVYQTAELILSEYPTLNLADINLVFKMAKLGKMGQFYDRLDGQCILGWFQKYFAERCLICAEKSIAESEHYKGSNTPSFEKITEMSVKKTNWR